MSADPPVVRARAVSVRRGGKLILDDLSLSVDRGSPFAIVGQSGSGKTTLLHCAAGLLPCDAGAVEIVGQVAVRLPARRRAELLGLVFQEYHLFPHLSVLDNVCLAPRLSARSEPEERARKLLEELGVGALGARFPHELSGGQKQRVAIARSLVLEPSVLFLDEPSAALDERTTAELAELLLELNARSQIIVVSHDRAFVERCCARGARIVGGRLAAEGEIGEIF